MFLMYGPNTNTSGGSIIFYLEAQAAYIRQALAAPARRRLPQPRRPARGRGGQQTARLQARFAGTAWTDCDSWYRDEHGRIVANWPGYMREYLERTRTFAPAEYVFSRSGASHLAGFWR